MSYAVMGYRANLALLASKIGVADKTLRLASRHALMRSFTGQRMNHGKSFSIAVSNLLIGPPFATAEASALGYAFEALCDAFGKSLFNNPVSPFRGSFLEDVNAHLKALGVAMVHRLVYRGAPVAIPPADEFPMIGHLTADEVAELAAAFGDRDLRVVTPGLVAMDEGLRSGVFEAAAMFRDWVREALEHREGLVAFFY